VRAIVSQPVTLRDGSLGYYARLPRTDDCFAAAVATTLHVPIEDVPDARLDERVAAGESIADVDRSAQLEWKKWLTRRGLRMVVHSKVPTNRRRWIGVIELGGPFNSHCLVMDRGRMLFDPSYIGDRLGRIRLLAFGPGQITHGLSFQTTRREDRKKRRNG
jgi:hypothetical protein